eukprot:GHVQ01037483.1.p1 GENE.GHVQ01037483.1~~GHVQ01037483.1.p1  ORF type:complete len:511 (-),score=82.40 GHVQ01037483.1:1375-2907(-)
MAQFPELGEFTRFEHPVNCFFENTIQNTLHNTIIPDTQPHGTEPRVKRGRGRPRGSRSTRPRASAGSGRPRGSRARGGKGNREEDDEGRGDGEGPPKRSRGGGSKYAKIPKQLPNDVENYDMKDPFNDLVGGGGGGGANPTDMLQQHLQQQLLIMNGEGRQHNSISSSSHNVPIFLQPQFDHSSSSLPTFSITSLPATTLSAGSLLPASDSPRNAPSVLSQTASQFLSDLIPSGFSTMQPTSGDNVQTAIPTFSFSKQAEASETTAALSLEYKQVELPTCPSPFPPVVDSATSVPTESDIASTNFSVSSIQAVASSAQPSSISGADSYLQDVPEQQEYFNQHDNQEHTFDCQQPQQQTIPNICLSAALTSPYQFLSDSNSPAPATDLPQPATEPFADSTCPPTSLPSSSSADSYEPMSSEIPPHMTILPAPPATDSAFTDPYCVSIDTSISPPAPLHTSVPETDLRHVPPALISESSQAQQPDSQLASYMHLGSLGSPEGDTGLTNVTYG